MYLNKPIDWGFSCPTIYNLRAWDIGLQDMCIGESRVIRAPPEFAFGSYALGSHVPANATLKYQFDLVDVDPRAKVPNHFEKCMHWLQLA